MIDLERLSGLLAKVPGDDFGAAVLDVVSSVARIENFGAYSFADVKAPQPVLTFWSGRISDYWFRRDADFLLASPARFGHMMAQLDRVEADSIVIDRWHPSEGGKRWSIYQRNGVIERIALTSRQGRSGLRSFFLRSASDGWLSDADYEGLCAVLPVVHQLIGLRQHIVGSKGRPLASGGRATQMKAAGPTSAFATLSAREAQVCDLLIEGKSVAGTALELGIGEATVRTLRARSYRKLQVGSAVELMALVVDLPRVATS